MSVRSTASRRDDPGWPAPHGRERWTDTSITPREALGRDGWEYITKEAFLDGVSWDL